MKLLCDPVTTSCRPILFLVGYLSLDIDVERLSLRAGDTRTPAFLRHNPRGKVPVLLVEDRSIAECAAILRYLATTAAPALYPDAPMTRARVDEMLSLFGSDFHTAFATMTVYPAAMNPNGFAPDVVAALGEAARPQVDAILDLVEARLDREPWIAGPALTIADFLAVAYLSIGALIGHSLERWPRITAWQARMRGLPGYRESFAPFEALVAMRRGASA